jgi:hypothetical protein
MSVVVARRHTTREKAAQTERGHCRAAGLGCHFCCLAQNLTPMSLSHLFA